MSSFAAALRLFVCFALYVTLALPSFAAEKDGGQSSSAPTAPAASAAPAPKKDAAPAPKKGAAPAQKKPYAPTSQTNGDPIQQKLDNFAKQTITSINRAILPSAHKKEVNRNADGTFTARYIEVDPGTISTSYTPPEERSKTVSYIGYMHYVEIEYASTAKERQEALNGPFTAKRRHPMTELVKYVKGKWTY